MIFKTKPIVAYLVFVSDQDSNDILNKYELVNGEQQIGKNLFENDIIMNFKGISNKHLKIIVTQNKVLIQDLDSENGTFIQKQNQKIQIKSQKPISIKEYEVFYISEYKFYYNRLKIQQQQQSNLEDHVIFKNNDNFNYLHIQCQSNQKMRSKNLKSIQQNLDQNNNNNNFQQRNINIFNKDTNNQINFNQKQQEYCEDKNQQKYQNKQQIDIKKQFYFDNNINQTENDDQIQRNEQIVSKESLTQQVEINQIKKRVSHSQISLLNFGVFKIYIQISGFVLNQNQKKKLKNLNIQIVEQLDGNYDLLVIKEYLRSIKYLISINKGIPIIQYQWILDQIEQDKQLNYNTYVWQNSKIKNNPNYLSNFKFWMPYDIKPSYNEMKILIQSAGGQIQEKINTDKNIIILLSKNQKNNYKTHKVYTTDLIFDGVQNGKLNLNENQY